MEGIKPRVVSSRRRGDRRTVPAAMRPLSRAGSRPGRGSIPGGTARSLRNLFHAGRAAVYILLRVLVRLGHCGRGRGRLLGVARRGPPRARIEGDAMANQISPPRRIRHQAVGVGGRIQSRSRAASPRPRGQGRRRRGRNVPGGSPREGARFRPRLRGDGTPNRRGPPDRRPRGRGRRLSGRGRGRRACDDGRRRDDRSDFHGQALPGKPDGFIHQGGRRPPREARPSFRIAPSSFTCARSASPLNRSRGFSEFPVASC
jgi:hypothetical protein